MNPGQSTDFQDSSDEIAFFNGFTQKMDYDTLTPYGYQSILRAFNHFIGPNVPRINNAVDLGCGTGSFTRRLKDQWNFHTYGVDIAFQAICRAKNKKDGIKYFVSNISRLGIKNESMDLVIFSGVLHHFPRPEQCLHEAFRILKHGGIILSYDPHINNPCMWLYRHPSSPFCSKTGRTDNEKLLKKQEMIASLTEARFADIKTRAISGVTMTYVESRKARIFLPLYNMAEYFLGLTPLAKAFGSFLICYAQKK